MKRRFWIAGVLALAGCVLAVTLALAAGGYELKAWVAASGGGVFPGGGYSLTGSIGQAEAGPAWSGGPYALNGGFLAGGYRMEVFMPLIIR